MDEIDVKKVIDSLEELINSDRNERALQVFLEEHPWLLDEFHGRSIDPPFVVSQLPLGVDHRCDFAFIIGILEETTFA